MQLRGAKIWLIGASEGIGRALAIALAAEGATVGISARQQARLDSLIPEMSGSGHSVAVVAVTSLESVQQAYRHIHGALGGCDVILYNAGIYTPMRAASWNLQLSEATLQVNFGGAMRVLDTVLPDLLARQQGRLIFVSSVAAYRGLPNSMAYGASKAALTNLTESLRIELQPQGIAVQLISPGFVKTRLTDANDFPMPFVISAESAAKRIIAGIKDDRPEIHFPKRFSLFMKLLRILPNQLFYPLMRLL